MTSLRLTDAARARNLGRVSGLLGRHRMIVRRSDKGTWFWYCPWCEFSPRYAGSQDAALRLANHHRGEAHPRPRSPQLRGQSV